MDFLINDVGEISFSTPKKYDKLRIDWYDSDYPVLRIDFEQRQEYPPRIFKNKRLRIDFNTTKGEELNNRRVNTIHGDNELRQRIAIRLRTELGDIALKPNFGSLLVTQKHRDILSEEVQKNIEQIVLRELSDILSNPRVVAVPTKTSGPFFCQNIRIIIFDNEELIYSLLL